MLPLEPICKYLQHNAGSQYYVTLRVRQNYTRLETPLMLTGRADVVANWRNAVDSVAPNAKPTGASNAVGTRSDRHTLELPSANT